MTIHCFGTNILCNDADLVEMDVLDNLGHARTVSVTKKDALFYRVQDGHETLFIYVSRPVPFDVLELRFYCGSKLLVQIHA